MKGNIKDWFGEGGMSHIMKGSVSHVRSFTVHCNCNGKAFKNIADKQTLIHIGGIVSFNERVHSFLSLLR